MPKKTTEKQDLVVAADTKPEDKPVVENLRTQSLVAQRLIYDAPWKLKNSNHMTILSLRI